MIRRFYYTLDYVLSGIRRDGFINSRCVIVFRLSRGSSPANHLFRSTYEYQIVLVHGTQYTYELEYDNENVPDISN